MKWYAIEFQGKMVRVPALKSQGHLWFHWQGETHLIEATDSGRRSQGERASAQPGVLSAPMPGKVTRVAVKLGDSVVKGQAVVVMEAMKMEYTLQADLDGQVSEVKVSVGQQVGLGEVLVRVKGSGEIT